MKLVKIIGKYNALSAMVNREGLPFDMAYAIALNLDILEKPVQIYQKKRSEIAMKYAEKDETGKFIEKNGEVTLTDRTAFFEEISEILDKDIDISDTPLHKIKKADIAAIGVSVTELRPLLDLIEE